MMPVMLRRMPSGSSIPARTRRDSTSSAPSGEAERAAIKAFR
jgi:hypothetical protein